MFLKIHYPYLTFYLIITYSTMRNLSIIPHSSTRQRLVVFLCLSSSVVAWTSHSVSSLYRRSLRLLMRPEDYHGNYGQPPMDPYNNNNNYYYNDGYDQPSYPNQPYMDQDNDPFGQYDGYFQDNGPPPPPQYRPRFNSNITPNSQQPEYHDSRYRQTPQNNNSRRRTTLLDTLDYLTVPNMLRTPTRRMRVSTFPPSLLMPPFLTSPPSILGSMAAEMRLSMQRMEDFTQPLLQQAARYVNDNAACQEALGGPIELGRILSQSSATVSINGQSRQQTTLQVVLQGSLRSGSLQLVATNNMIQQMMVQFADGRYYEMPLPQQQQQQRGNNSNAGYRHRDLDVLDVEAVPDDEELPQIGPTSDASSSSKQQLQ